MQIDLLLRQSAIPVLEAQLLYAHAAGQRREWVLARRTDDAQESHAAIFKALALRRQQGEPLAYIVGQREFYGRSFIVNPDVLIPRPETEHLVEQAIMSLSGQKCPENQLNQGFHILDVCTGSGIVAITLALELRSVQPQVTAADISAPALTVAQQNAERLGADVRCVLSDVYAAFTDHSFDLIVANPPYIRAQDPHLTQGDLRYEPALALTDHADGLQIIDSIIAGAPKHLRDGGWCLLEHGFDQGQACRDRLLAAGLTQVQTVQDLAGLDRISMGQKTQG